MAANTSETVFTGNADGLIAAYQAVIEQNKRNEEALRQAKATAREAHRQQQADLREEAELQRQVAAALKTIQTPLDALKQKRSEYRALLEQGKLTEDQYRQLLAKGNEELKKARENTDEHRRAVAAATEAERKRNEELREGAQLTREVMTPTEKYREKIQQLEKALQAGAIDQQTFNRQVDRANDELAKTAPAASAAETAIKGFVAGFLGMQGVQTILEGVRAEMEMLKRLGEGSLNANLSFAEAMFAAKDAFTPDATMSDADLEPAVQAIADRSGTIPGIVAQGVPGITAAKNKLSNRLSFDVLQESFRLSPGDLETAMNNAPAALDLMNQMGITDPKVALSLLDQVSQNARVEGPQFVGKNLAPAIGGLTKYGDSPEQAAELVSAMTTLLTDKTGERTRTAVASLADQLRTAVPEGGSTTERLSILQRDPERAKAFLSTMNAEAANRIALEGLVTGSAESTQTLAAKQAGIMGIGTPDEQAAHVARHEAKIAALAEGLGGQMRTAEQRAAVGLELERINNEDRTIEGQARRRLDEFLDNTNTFGPDGMPLFGTDQAARKQFEGRLLVGQDPNAAAISTIQNYRLGLSSEDDQVAARQIAILEEMLALQKAARDRPQPVEIAGGQPVSPAAEQGR